MGGISPSGFDCSGFVNYLYKPFVPALPRISSQIADFGHAISRDSLIPGDLVFFATGSSSSRITHVAIYIGQDSLLHAISNGPDRGVTITSLSARYWKNRYYSAARVLPEMGKEVKTVEDLRFAKGYYSGDVVNGEPQGQGILEMDNGDRYEGAFFAGMFHGRGTYTWANGQSQSGDFQNGRFLSDQKKGENYLKKEDSPWEDFDGLVEGDFQLWLNQEKDSFEEWKKHN